MKSMKFNPLTRLVMAAALAIGLAGCGGSSNTPPATETPEPPTPYESAQADIAAATTPEAAQAALDAVKDDVTAAQGARLQAAVDARVEVLEKMGRAADQKMALTTTAGNIDTSDLMTAEDIATANAAIAALKAALAAATDVSDADKAMYQGQVDAAETAVAAAQSTLDHDAQMTALTGAVTALQAIDLSNLSTQEAIDAAGRAIEALRTALENATELSEAEKTAAMIELATADRIVMAAQGSVDTEDQMTMLSDAYDALKAIDFDDLMTQAQIDAANKAIAALDLALAAATNLTDAQRLDATVDKRVAERKVEAAETVLAENVGDQRMALTVAKTALDAIDLDDLDTAEKIAKANDAVAALKAALDGATHLSETAKAMYQDQLDTATETVRMADSGMDREGRMMAQRSAITDAVTMARTAVRMVDDDATEAEVTTADEAVAALKAAIEGAADLEEGDTDVAEAKGTLATLEPQLAAAKTSRMAAMEKEQDAETSMMAVDAAKLYAAISPASGDGADVTAGARFADINPVSADDPTPFISVNYGGELETAGQANSATLNLDKDTMVADHHGWNGARYIEKDDDGNIITEAVVYSDESPTMGAKFNSGTGDDGNVGFDLNDAGALVLTGDLNTASRIASPRFTHGAGTYTFELPEPENNPERTSLIPIPGSYYGVSGTYTCTPGTGASACGVARAANGGYTFVTPASWTFKPTNPNARVTESADTLYAVYGWWLRKPAGNGAWTASAFDDYYGDPVAITGLLDALNGTATYTGGAAGKYALSSSTGGDNDAGHFTARATLEADFDTDTITGTIDQFMSDGAAKDWSVALNKSDISESGGIAGAGDDTDMQKTVWTIGDDAAAASGQWRGQFRDVVAPPTGNGVPAVVTGDFYTEYGNSGKMVGAFGAKTE